ncbi:MAG TPA: MarR family transcriptional regulator [Aggregatilineales bacterium]|nr:MarR family transcriptional regulator [Aggregatilineales bacterium]
MSDTSIISDANLLAQFSQMYRNAIDTFMDEVGMHRGQAFVLCQVVKQDGMTQTEIAEALSVQGATITNMLKRMEESNLIVRRRDAQDNRLVRVYATATGVEQEISINEQLKSLDDSILSGISTADREVLRRVVWQMIGNMDKHS